MIRKVYSKEQLDFLTLAAPVLTWNELIDEFFIRFNEVKNYSQLRASMKNHGIKNSKKRGNPKGVSLLFSREQVDFIKEKYKCFSVRDLTEELNKKFNTDIKTPQLRAFVNNHKISCGRNGQFAPGFEPWNKGTKGATGANSGSFKKGSIPANVKPIGHERTCSKDGIILVKVDEVNPYSSTGYRGRYRPKHHVVWEQHNGPIPKGMVVRFRDNDRLNCDIKNLEMVTKAEHLQLNRNDYANTPEELKPTVKIIAQLSMKSGEAARKSREENHA